MTNAFQSVLFLSTGRTGTKFLASTLMKLLPDAVVLHEGGERSRLINICFNAHLAGLVPEDAAIYFWKKSLAPGLARAQEAGSLYIDANNHLYGLAVKRPELYPNLKVVHLVRDPRTYIRSHLNWSRGRVRSFLANYMTPFWQPTGFLMGSETLPAWMGYSKLERFAWIWRFKNEWIAQLKDGPVPYLLVRFEDLFTSPNPEDHFKKILAFLEVRAAGELESYLKKPINTSDPRSVPDWENWPEQTLQRVYSICGALMASYGYAVNEAGMD